MSNVATERFVSKAKQVSEFARAVNDYRLMWEVERALYDLAVGGTGLNLPWNPPQPAVVGPQRPTIIEELKRQEEKKGEDTKGKADKAEEVCDVVGC